MPGTVVLQAPFVATGAVWSKTAGPEGAAAELTTTRTVELSPAPAPAVPVMATLPGPTRPFAAGCVMVTVGAVLSIVNATGPAEPVLPAVSVWLTVTT